MKKPRFLGFVFVCGFMFSVAVARAEDGETLSLADGDRVVMTYNAARIESPDRDAPWYGRSGFIHPVFTPSGRAVTEGFPVDHMHQHGVMFAWTSSAFEGHKVNFWDSKSKQGRIEHVETVSSDSDKIVVRLRHVDTTTTTPTAVLNETWEITRVPHDSMHVFDLVSIQTCASEKPLLIEKYHYGAMCIRGPVAWLDRRATMVTNEGKNREPGNHSRPNWVTMHGKLDGAECGITAMSHPDNFRSPQPVRLHPSKPYFCFAPMVLGDFRIEADQPYVSRFRFVAFDGKPDETKLNAMWKHFSER